VDDARADRTVVPERGLVIPDLLPWGRRDEDDALEELEDTGLAPVAVLVDSDPARPVRFTLGINLDTADLELALVLLCAVHVILDEGAAGFGIGRVPVELLLELLLADPGRAGGPIPSRPRADDELVDAVICELATPCAVGGREDAVALASIADAS
jgi:hypothetical protein